MGRHLAGPRLLRWGPKGQKAWYAFYPDRIAGKTIRKSCHALGARDEESRLDLLKRLRLRDKADLDAVHGLTPRSAYHKPLGRALGLFLADVKARARVRRANPESREGLSKAGAYNLRLVVKAFRRWVRKQGGMACEKLDAPTLRAFFSDLSRRRKIKTSTANLYRNRLKTCLRWLDSLRPRLFPDAALFWPVLRAMPVDARPGSAYRPRELKAFRDNCGPKLRRLFLLIALTGCRRKEAVRLLWADVDTSRGRITYRSTKTGRARLVPLTKAPEGEIAPKLARAMKNWPRKSERVCGYKIFPIKRWNRAGKLRPQALRRNFTSYAASLGIPASICAMWQGHSAEVAERHYRQMVLERKAARSIEAAMGLDG